MGDGNEIGNRSQSHKLAASQESDNEFQEKFLKALKVPARSLLTMARDGDRVPLADHLQKGAECMRLLQERLALRGLKERQHVRDYPGLERQVERFIQSLKDPELLEDLSLLVREGKKSGPKWSESRSKRRLKHFAYAAVCEVLDTDPTGGMKPAEAIRTVADNQEVCAQLGLEHDNAADRLKDWYYEIARENKLSQRRR